MSRTFREAVSEVESILGVRYTPKEIALAELQWHVRRRGLRYGERFVYTAEHGSYLQPRELIGLWLRVSEQETVDGLRWRDKTGMISGLEGTLGLPD